MTMAKMAGRPTLSSWLALGVLAFGAFAVPLGCEGLGGKPDAPPSAADLPEEVRDALSGALEDVWPRVLSPTLSRSQTAAADLRARLTEWQSALEDGSGSAALENTQAAFLALMAVWQEAEVMQLGPAASSLSAIGGEDLRDAVYSWTTVNACRVDQETVEVAWDEADFFASNLVNVVGLDAIEVLLFTAPSENACPSQVPPNSNDAWTDLGENGVSRSRAAYALALTDHVQDTIEQIQATWEPSGGDFGGKLAQAGAAGSPFASQTEGLNAIFDALFYLETRTKDKKLGWPLGETDCGLDDCTDQLESPFAGASHRWIGANLQGFRALFTGGDGLGMDDLLVSLDHENLVDDLHTALDAAEAAAAAMPGPIEDHDAEAAQLFATTKEVTDLLKGDVATVLSLQIPVEAAGDND
jgi:predicted lipoprotein